MLATLAQLADELGAPLQAIAFGALVSRSPMVNNAALHR